MSKKAQSLIEYMLILMMAAAIAAALIVPMNDETRSNQQNAFETIHNDADDKALDWCNKIHGSYADGRCTPP